jgi:exopolysaccharide biosynthesis protein
MSKHRGLGFLFLLITLFGAESGASDFSLKKHPLTACTGGYGIVAGFPFHAHEFRENYDLVVVGEGFRTLPSAVNYLKRHGFQVVAVINGGFFGGSRIYSYFKSSALRSEHSSNSALSPRACMVFDRSKGALEVVQSTSSNYQEFRNRDQIEVFCAGPQLVENGANVAKRQACSEKFRASCRADGKDPGLNLFGNEPRSASCVTAMGDLKLFSFNSSVRRCGASAQTLAQVMIKEGCESGLNHDGGGSAKLYLDLGDGRRVTSLGRGGDKGRAVPVWIAVVKK